MSDIDFQNGFICGMATKGLTRSGDSYKPLIWNDVGVYTYFYIDFKKSMDDFSIGMWNESCLIFGITGITVTNVERVSASIFKVYANIANLIYGVVILNKKTSVLTFSNGEQLPAFAAHFYVAGIAPYIQLKYCYEKAVWGNRVFFSNATEVTDVDISAGSVDIEEISESATFVMPYTSVTETPIVTLK